jgi:hypothetical protein
MARKTGKYNEPSPWANEIPYTIYFYYAKARRGIPGYDTTAYIWVEDTEILPAMLPSRIARLTSNARKTDPIDPRPIGRAIKDVPWWKISYLVVAVEGGDGFEPKKAVEIIRHDDGNDYSNHCFFDGGDGKIPVQDEDDIWALWTVNHMKNRSGQDIPEDKIHKFSLRFRPKGRRLARPQNEDHGTNMGPPIGPP